MINLSSPLPERVFRRLSSESTVFEHAARVNSDRWQRLLAERNLPPAAGKLGAGGRVLISRFDVFDMGRQAPSRSGAMALLYNSMAWGLGLPGAWLHSRIDGLAEDADRAAGILEDVWAASHAGETPEGAYKMLATPRGAGRIPRLGPAFGTKFLYFSQGPLVRPRYLVLDRVVAGKLKDLGTWPDARNDSWTPATYADYCRLLEQWALEAKNRLETDTEVRADQIEHTLFKLK